MRSLKFRKKLPLFKSHRQNHGQNGILSPLRQIDEITYNDIPYYLVFFKFAINSDSFKIYQKINRK